MSFLDSEDDLRLFYEENKEYLDKDFEKKVTEDPKGRYLELISAVFLHDNGFKFLSRATESIEFVMEREGKKFLFQCYSFEQGKVPPAPIDGSVCDVPVVEIKKRLRLRVRDKINKNISCLQKIYPLREYYYILVLTDSKWDTPVGGDNNIANPPYWIEAFFENEWKRVSGRNSNITFRLISVPNILEENLSGILFCSKAHKKISNIPDFVFLHNPNSIDKIDLDVFSMISQFYFDNNYCLQLKESS